MGHTCPRTHEPGQEARVRSNPNSLRLNPASTGWCRPSCSSHGELKTRLGEADTDLASSSIPGLESRVSEPIQLRTEQIRPSVMMVRVSGRLDARNATDLMALCAPFRAPGHTLIIHLGGVDFIASSGVGVLLALVEEFRMRGGVVRLTSLSPAVDDVLRLLQLDRFLEIDTDETQSKDRAA